MSRRKKPTIEVVEAKPDEFDDPKQLEELIERQYRIARILERDLATARARQKEAN